MNHILTAYVPYWLSHRLVDSAMLPGTAHALQAIVLLADLVGFTPLTEALAQRGSEGVETLGQVMDAVFGVLVETVYAHGGDVVKISGDAMLAFWPLDESAGSEDNRRADTLSTHGWRAVAAAQAIQKLMPQFDQVATPAGPMSLALRVGLGCGSLTAVVLGDEAQQRFVCSGPALEAAAVAEKQAQHGQITLHPSLHKCLATAVSHPPPTIPAAQPQVPLSRLTPFVHPAIVERLEGGQGNFLADFRYNTVPMFVSFTAVGAEALQTYVGQAMALIAQHGGYLLEVEVGDKGNVLVILFGVPLSSGDNHVRAVACALDLAALPGTRGIGATTGTIFTGIMGNERRCQYNVLGDEINLAARLMEAALTTTEDLSGHGRAPIFLSAHVSKALHTTERFIYDSPRSLAIKGKSHPVTVVPLLGKAERHSDWISPWLNTESIIGRHKELRRIDEYMALSLAQQGHLLVLTGEAGMGKSCLGGELLRRWLLRGGQAYVGAGLASTRHTPYAAWSELLRAFFDLPGNAQDAAHIERHLRELGPELILRLPLLSDVMGLGLPDNDLTRHFDARLRQQSTQALLVELARARAAQQPLLLVLEDAHWLDQLSWELLLAVARAIGDAPVLLCLVHRPLDEPPPAAYRALTGLAHYAALTLTELNPAEAHALACARLGVDALPPPLADLVQAKAQGHPFFIEEIIHALRDSAALRVAENQVVIQRDLAQIKLPDTVQGVVQTRLDRLDENTRLTLKVASVIGRSFPYPPLQAIHPLQLPKADMLAQLRLLQQLDITLLERAEPELLYVFKHTITQEVAYQTMTFAQRRDLHRAAAGWYEAHVGAVPDYALLAHHYRYAEDAVRERRFVRLAGEQAAAQFANEEAVRHLSRALTLTPEKESAADRYALLRQREAVYDLQGNRTAQAQDLAEMSALIERLDDDRGRTEVALRQAHLAETTGDYAAAIAAAQQAVTMAQAAQTMRDEALGRLAWGRALLRFAEYGTAVTQYERSLTLARASQLSAIEADVLRDLGSAAWNQGDYAGAQACQEQALRIYRAAGDRRGESAALNNLGIIADDQGNYAEAEVYYEQALRLKHEFGDRRGESVALSNLGGVALLQGHYDRARHYLERALRLKREVADRYGEGVVLSHLGAIGLSLGDFATGRVHYEESLALCHSIGDRKGEGDALAHLGLIFHNLGDDAAARWASEQAVGLAAEIDDGNLQAYSLMCLGHVLTELAEWETAVHAYQRALDFQRETGREHATLESLAGLARVALLQERPSAALAHITPILNYFATTPAHGRLPQPCQVYLTCYQTLQANDEGERAAGMLAMARALLQEQAAQIADDTIRRSFLENVPAHRALMSL